jgi:hypothetical protein
MLCVSQASLSRHDKTCLLELGRHPVTVLIKAGDARPGGRLLVPLDCSTACPTMEILIDKPLQ